LWQARHIWLPVFAWRRKPPLVPFNELLCASWQLAHRRCWWTSRERQRAASAVDVDLAPTCDRRVVGRIGGQRGLMTTATDGHCGRTPEREPPLITLAAAGAVG
jgi:hypothetical protein